jgi:hypothetical protein
MPRDRMYVRRFLSEPGHHGGAYLLPSVPDTEGARGSYVESSVRFEIVDCARNVQLEFPLHDVTARRDSLKKARLLSRGPSRLRARPDRRIGGRRGPGTRATCRPRWVPAGERVDGSCRGRDPWCGSGG